MVNINRIFRAVYNFKKAYTTGANALLCDACTTLAKFMLCSEDSDNCTWYYMPISDAKCYLGSFVYNRLIRVFGPDRLGSHAILHERKSQGILWINKFVKVIEDAYNKATSGGEKGKPEGV